MKGKPHVPRRTILRGLAASIALPFLDGMVPAFAAPTATRRLSVVYLPNGIRMEHWTPSAAGSAAQDLPKILSPLQPFRDRFTLVSGLKNGAPHYAVHGAASTRFLTTMPPASASGAVVEAGAPLVANLPADRQW